MKYFNDQTSNYNSYFYDTGPSSEAFQIGQFCFEPYLAAQLNSLENYYLIHISLMEPKVLSIMTNLVEIPCHLNPAMDVLAAFV